MKLEKITKIILVLQIVIYIIAMLIIYTTRDANDLSGTEAVAPLFLFDILIPVTFLLVVINLVKKLTKKSRPDWKILCLFGVVIILGIFDQQIYTFVSGNN